MKRQTLTKCLKTLWGAHHFVYGSQDVADIAAVINVFPENVVKLMQSRNWDEALQFWNYTLPIGNLNIIERVWTEMIEKGEHIHLVEYPDKPIKSPPAILICLRCWIRTSFVPITSPMTKSAHGSQKNVS